MDLKRLRELEAKATLGPWHTVEDWALELIGYDVFKGADIAFIAEMRNALPELLDLAERAQRYETALREIAARFVLGAVYSEIATFARERIDRALEELKP